MTLTTNQRKAVSREAQARCATLSGIRLPLRLAVFCAAAALGMSAVPARGESVTDLPRSVGELMNMNPMDVMRIMDPGQQGMITKDQYMRFFSDLWDRMDTGRAGRVTREAFMTGWAARNK